MFKVEELVRVTIQVPQEDVSRVTEVFARFRLLHLVNIRETQLGQLGYVGAEDQSLLQEFENLGQEIKEIMKTLGLPLRPGPTPAPEAPEKAVYLVRERLDQIVKDVQEPAHRLKTIREKRRQKEDLLEKLRFLPEDFELDPLYHLRFTAWKLGLIHQETLPRLEEALARVHRAIVVLGKTEGRLVIMVFGLKKEWETFEKALRGAFFQEIDLKKEISRPVKEAKEELQKELEELAREEKTLQEELERLRQKWAEELYLLRERVLAAKALLRARKFFGKVGKSYFVSAWVPKRLYEKLEKEIKEATQGRALCEKTDPDEIWELKEGTLKIPILFNNPLLIKPFEKLTLLYGTPRYRELEPSVFMAVSFLIMFGLMFGDVGHGLVLFLLGLIIFRRLPRYFDYGILLMECGLSSALFGALYGSFFGMEDLIPALWFRPFENINYFLKVALFFGATLISLGLILNLINILRFREYEKLLSASGLAGALFYWLIVGLGVKYALVREITPEERKWAAWIGSLLILIMILNRPLYRLLIRRESPKSVFGRGFGVAFLESLIEVFDDLLRYLTNTVSFLRLAAFALTHVALFIAIFSMAEMIAQGGEGLSYWLTVILGNIFVIVLEGMVVSIQTLRLEYYEFFSHFFRGGGEPFKTFDQEVSALKSS